jgi:hypothetical protein
MSLLRTVGRKSVREQQRLRNEIHQEMIEHDAIGRGIDPETEPNRARLWLSRRRVLRAAYSSLLSE